MQLHQVYEAGTFGRLAENQNRVFMLKDFKWNRGEPVILTFEPVEPKSLFIAVMDGEDATP